MDSLTKTTISGVTSNEATINPEGAQGINEDALHGRPQDLESIKRTRTSPDRPLEKRTRNAASFAAVGGAIAGAYAGHKLSKGNDKFDNIATVVGAVVGGLGAREATEVWENHRRKDDRKEENWYELLSHDSNIRRELTFNLSGKKNGMSQLALGAAVNATETNRG